MGLPIFVGLRGMDIPELAGCLRAYRQAWREAGHPGEGDACLRIPIYAAPTDKAAREEPRDTITYYFERQANITLAPLGRAGTGPVEQRQTQAQRLSTLSYDAILARKVAFGTGPALVDRLGQLREELAVTGVAAELNPGGTVADGAGAAQPRDSHQAGDARVQIGAARAMRRVQLLGGARRQLGEAYLRVR